MKKIYTYTRTILYATMVAFVLAGTAVAEKEVSNTLFLSDWEYGGKADASLMEYLNTGVPVSRSVSATLKSEPARKVKNTMFLSTSGWDEKKIDSSLQRYLNSGVAVERRGLGYSSEKKIEEIEVRNTFFIIDKDSRTPDRALLEVFNSK